MLLKVIFLFILSISSVYSKDKTCIYINSYHDGFIWSDTIAKEIKTILKDSCTLIQFNMDTKRKKSFRS